jgi:hypothetical protein
MKPKTVTKQFIELTKENEKEEWKDGEKEKVSEYTVNVEKHDVTFVDMQRNREGHKVRIKWMEKCPGAPWPCRGERGYRHMHIASQYDINIPVDNSELTSEQQQKVRYLMGRDRVLFNPVGFKSDDWQRQFNRKQTPEDEQVPARSQKPIEGCRQTPTHPRSRKQIMLPQPQLRQSKKRLHGICQHGRGHRHPRQQRKVRVHVQVPVHLHQPHRREHRKRRLHGCV